MNENITQKPFACKADGCDMSFTNEDHLLVHEKRHEMVLNLALGNKTSNIFVADQTPTPTRLIKNCEEVGLFDDLKHVNPFDETFRRAVESKTAEDCTPLQDSVASAELSSLANNEDSLHTPQIFPISEGTEEVREDFKGDKEKIIILENVPVKKRKIAIPTENEIINDQHPHQTSDEFTSSGRIAENDKIHTDESISTATVNEVTQTKVDYGAVKFPVSTVSIIPSQIITIGYPPIANAETTIPANLSAINSKPFILPKPSSDGSAQSTEIQATFILTPSSSTNNAQCSQMLPAKERLKQALYNQRVAIKTNENFSCLEKKQNRRLRIKKPSPNQGIDPQELEDNLARKRAASTRYRTKMKRIHNELERKNLDLIEENRNLKAQVKQLQDILSTHVNCSSSTNPQEKGLLLQTAQALGSIPVIKVPPASLKLVMNIPELIIHPGDNQPKIVKIPITPSNIKRAEISTRSRSGSSK